jgi:hypothetical protein
VPDVLELASLLFAAGLLVAAAVALTALLRPAGRLDAAVTSGVLVTALAVLAVVIAGASRSLRPGPLLAVHALQAVLAVGLLVRRRAQPVGWLAGPTWSDLRAHPWEAGIVMIAAAALAWQLLVALVLPPYAYDALSYHLLTVFTWVKSGSLDTSPMNLCCAYYPANPDLLTAWPVVLLHSDALVGVVQVLAAVLCGLAVAGLGRTLGLGRAGAAAAGALFVLTPALLAQAPTPYVDVVMTAWVLAGLHGTGRYALTGQRSAVAVTALCAGLLAGTKGTGPIWAVALCVLVLAVAAQHWRTGRATARASGVAVVTMAAAGLVLGGWWYVRSAVATGNPLYPFEVSLGGARVFEGPLTVAEVLTPPDRGADRPWPVAVLASWASDLLPWRHGSYEYQQRSGGLGPLWAWLGAPLLLPALVLLWRQRRTALVTLLPVLAVLFVQPYRWWARFTLPLAAVGVLAVLLIDTRCRRALTRGVLRATTTALVVLGAALVLVEVNPASRAEPLPAREVLALIGSPAEQRTVGALFFPEYAFLADVPEDAVVVVDVEAPQLRFLTPVFGRDLGRTVVPAGDGPVPDDAWVVTGEERPLDAAMAEARSSPVADEAGVRVWAPEG